MQVLSGSYAESWFRNLCVEPKAAARILSQLYPDGPKCASCRAAITGRRALESWWRGDRTYCASCGSKFSPRAGTILDGSHLTFAQFESIRVLLSLGIDHQRIATIAGVHIDTVRVWHAKIEFWERHV